MRRSLLLVPAALALLVACGGAADDAPAEASASPTSEAPGDDIEQADDDLRVVVDPGDGSAGVTWTLSCVGEASGSHPDPAAACAHLAGVEAPFAPLPEDVVCTEQYGGPQQALVTGRWGGEPVELELSRTDGCRIAQWDALGPLLPAAD